MDGLKLSEVKAGNIIVANGFTCLKDGDHCTVQSDDDGNLFVLCDGPDGENEPCSCRHHLDGIDGTGGLIGFERAAWQGFRP